MRNHISLQLSVWTAHKIDMVLVSRQCKIHQQHHHTISCLSTRMIADVAGSSSRLVIPVHATASGNLEAEGFLGAVVKPGRRHATPAYLQGLQANVSSNTPAHLRLYQVKNHWASLFCVALRYTACPSFCIVCAPYNPVPAHHRWSLCPLPFPHTS